MDRNAFLNSLSHFTGTTGYVRHGMMRSLLMTDGTYWLKENGAAWFIDLIVSYQPQPHVKAERFQCWVLKVDTERHTGVATMGDGRSKREIVRQEIEFTDCPCDLKVYVIEEGEHRICLLASEY